jgi:AmpD protein
MDRLELLLSATMTRIDTTSGLLPGARFVASPNHDERPDGAVPEVLVIHSISLPPGQFGGDAVEALFTNRLDPNAHPSFRDLQSVTVSAHLFVRRNGDVVQFVPFHRRAWHAGESYCEGRTRVNDFSIGIELEGTDSGAFEDIQYARLIEIARAVARTYPAITPQRIYGHSDIAPGRKSDPGTGFDWERFLSALT